MNNSPQASPMSPAQQALALAQQQSDAGADWTRIHNAVFGIGGACMQLFPQQADRVTFSQSPEYAQILKLLDQAPGRLRPEANGKILIHVPKSIHAALLAEAEAEGATLNTLIVAKLAAKLGATLR